MIRTSLCAAALALSAIGAQAAAEYGGHFGTNPAPFAMPHGFLDADDTLLHYAYFFQLDGAHGAFALGFVSDPGGEFEAVASMLTLWRSNGDHDLSNDQLLGGFDFGEQAVAQSFKGLTSGEYFWRIESRVTGSGGNVVFAAALSPVNAVPEPASFALLGAGLLGIGAFARRRGQLRASR